MLNNLDDIKDKATSLQNQLTDVDGLKAKSEATKSKIKELGIGSIAVLILGIFAQFILPWWVVGLVGFYVGCFVFDSPAKSFAYGFAALSLLWGMYAGILSYTNGGTVTSAISNMMGSKVSGTQLIYLTGIIGGLVGGMGAMTGTLFRRLFHKD
jgi:hypothetical protein